MEIEKSWDLPFQPEAVYAAWVSSNTVIPPATHLDIKPELGGYYRLMMETPDFNGRNEGEFLVVEPCSRVRYTWEWNGDGEISTIDASCSVINQGTPIDLKHTGFTHPESVKNHDVGWDSYIEGFTQFLTGS